MDIQHELEQAVGHGPTLPTPQQRLVAGQVALRRRRMGLGAGAVAVLVATAAPFTVATNGTERGTDLAPTAPSVTPSPTKDGVVIFRERIRLARFEADGSVWIHPGTVVHERRADVVPGASQSVALDATYRGRRSWLLFSQVDGTSANGIYSGPGDDTDLYATFDEFVAEGSLALSRRAAGTAGAPDVPPTREGES